MSNFLAAYSKIPFGLSAPDISMNYEYEFDIVFSSMNIVEMLPVSQNGIISTRIEFDKPHNYKAGETIFIEDPNNYGRYNILLVDSNISIIIDYNTPQSIGPNAKVYRNVPYTMPPNLEGKMEVNLSPILRTFVTENLNDGNLVYSGNKTRFGYEVIVSESKEAGFTFTDNYWLPGGKIGFVAEGTSINDKPPFQIGDTVNIQQELYKWDTTWQDAYIDNRARSQCSTIIGSGTPCAGMTQQEQYAAFTSNVLTFDLSLSPSVSVSQAANFNLGHNGMIPPPIPDGLITNVLPPNKQNIPFPFITHGQELTIVGSEGASITPGQYDGVTTLRRWDFWITQGSGTPKMVTNKPTLGVGLLPASVQPAPGSTGSCSVFGHIVPEYNGVATVTGLTYSTSAPIGWVVMTDKPHIRNTPAIGGEITTASAKRGTNWNIDKEPKRFVFNARWDNLEWKDDYEEYVLQKGEVKKISTILKTDPNWSYSKRRKMGLIGRNDSAYMLVHNEVDNSLKIQGNASPFQGQPGAPVRLLLPINFNTQQITVGDTVKNLIIATVPIPGVHTITFVNQTSNNIIVELDLPWNPPLPPPSQQPSWPYTANVVLKNNTLVSDGLMITGYNRSNDVVFKNFVRNNSGDNLDYYVPVGLGQLLESTDLETVSGFQSLPLLNETAYKSISYYTACATGATLGQLNGSVSGGGIASSNPSLFFEVDTQDVIPWFNANLLQIGQTVSVEVTYVVFGQTFTTTQTGPIIGIQAGQQGTTIISIDSFNPGGAFGGSGVIKGFTANISECIAWEVADCSKYQHYNVIFKDKRGSWTSYPFNLISRDGIEVERNNFYKREQLFGNDSYDRGEKSFAVRSRDTILLTSDWVTDDRNYIIKDLFQSASVYVQGEDGVLIAAQIIDTETEIFKDENDMIHNYQIAFRLSKENWRF